MAFPVATTGAGNWAAGSNAAGSSTATITIPANVVSGDVMFLFTHFNSGSSGGAVDATATGWTYANSRDSNTNQTHVTLLTRVATGAEGGTTFTVNKPSALRIEWIIHRITGADGSYGTIDTAHDGTFSNEGYVPPPFLDPSGWGLEDTLWIVFAAIQDTLSGDLSGIPAGFSSWGEQPQQPAERLMRTYYLTTNAQYSSYDPGNITVPGSLAGGQAWTIAVRPAGAADTLPPVVPTGLACNTQTDTSLIWTWNATTDQGGGTVAGYILRTYDQFDGLITSYDVGNVLTKTVTGLSPATLYKATVTAYDFSTNECAETAKVSATTLSKKVQLTLRDSAGALLTNATSLIWWVFEANLGATPAPLIGYGTTGTSDANGICNLAVSTSSAVGTSTTVVVRKTGSPNLYGVTEAVLIQAL